METLAQIKTNLKRLRLSSFYDNLEHRVDEAIHTKMSYHDFLLVLTQDEIDRRKYQKTENAIKKAGLGKYKPIVEFDFEFNPHINRQQMNTSGVSPAISSGRMRTFCWSALPVWGKHVWQRLLRTRHAVKGIPPCFTGP